MADASDFEYAVKRTLKDEGGAMVTNHDWDPGGLTKYGISQKSNPEVDVANLTEEEAIAIYKKKYWDTLGLDGVNSRYVAAEMFDTCVNMGVHRAGKIAQEAINLLTSSQALVVDGIVGPKTIKEINALSKRYETALVVALNLVQGMYYMKIMMSNPSLGKAAAKGWMLRLLPPKELSR